MTTFSDYPFNHPKNDHYYKLYWLKATLKVWPCYLEWLEGILSFHTQNELESWLWSFVCAETETETDFKVGDSDFTLKYLFLNIFNRCTFILSAYMHCQVTCRRWLQLTLHTIRPGLALGLPSKITCVKDMCNRGNSTSFLFISKRNITVNHNRLSLKKFCCYEYKVI